MKTFDEAYRIVQGGAAFNGQTVAEASPDLYTRYKPLLEEVSTHELFRSHFRQM